MYIYAYMYGRIWSRVSGTATWRQLPTPAASSRSTLRPTPEGDLTTYLQYSLVSVLDVTPEPQPLFCRLQGLGVSASRTPTP